VYRLALQIRNALASVFLARQLHQNEYFSRAEAFMHCSFLAVALSSVFIVRVG